MSGIVFINYRRQDAAGMAGRLFDRLEQEFASEQLFFDVDNIPPGKDFVAYLNDKVSACDVLLAVIGPDWQSQLDRQDYKGESEQSEDFVRIEIEAALRQGKTVIPVLVSGAEMPRSHELPGTLQPFARRNAVRLSHERFRADAAGITNALKSALAEAEATRQQVEMERSATAEREAKERAEREAKDQAEKDAAQRTAAVPGLSPEQIAKAEELANWDFIKDAPATQDLQDHLTRFAGGVTARMARAKLEAIVWNELGGTPSIDALGRFLEAFPDGKHAATARAKLDLQREAETEQRAGIEVKRNRPPAAAPQTPAPQTPAPRTDARAASLKTAPDVSDAPVKPADAKPPKTGDAIWPFPVAVLAGLGALSLVTRLLTGEPLRPSIEAYPIAVLCVPLVVLGLAALLAHRPRTKTTGAKISSYWLGCILALTLAFWAVFNANEWVWPALGAGVYGDVAGGNATGLLLVFLAALGSASWLAYRPGRQRTSARRTSAQRTSARLTSAEISTYWLGCVLPLTPLLVNLFLHNRWTWPDLIAQTYEFSGSLAAFAIGVTSAVILARRSRDTLSRADVFRYWLGSALPLFVMIAVIDTGFAVLVSPLVVAGFGFVWLFWWYQTRESQTRSVDR